VDVVRVYRKGVVVLPESVLERAGIREGMLLTVEVRDGEVVLRPLDLWERICGSGKGVAWPQVRGSRLASASLYVEVRRRLPPPGSGAHVAV